MTSYDIYVLILCLIVFTLLTTVFACMLAIMAKQSLRLIEAGTEDERIYEEYIKTQQRGKKTSGWLSIAFTALFACIITAVFTFTLVVQLSENKQTKNIPTLRVVYSESMSAKYEKNEYLFQNNLNDQFSRFDIVVTYKLPKEEDLKLYDIVVYEVDNVLLIHRIVGIEEPNEKHPNERHFLLQGDLVERADKFPVRYSQMKAIYRGEHVPFIGSFVMFLQSPAGYICLILVLVEMIAAPLITKQLEKAESARLAILKKKKKEEEEKKAQEEQRILEEQRALAEQRASEEQKASAEQQVLQEKSAIEESTTVEEQNSQEKETLAPNGKKTLRIASFHVKKKKEGEKKAQEEQRALDEQRALEEQRALDEQRALEEQRALDEQRALEEQRALDEQRMLDEQRVSEEQKVSAEQQVLQEKSAIEESTTVEEQNSQEKETLAPNGKKTLRIASFHMKKKRKGRRHA